MARIFITGSADGLGQLTAQSLIGKGHSVVLHARNDSRGEHALGVTPGAERVLTGDLSDMEATKNLAKAVNEIGPFDAVIHNAGVYQVPAQQLFMVNTLAPYILSCLIRKPGRLIYLSSGMHLGGHSRFDAFKSDISRISYSDTKLHVLMLCKAVARRWPGVYANAVDPGWVPTRMGGRGATGSLQKGYETQVWLAEGTDENANLSGAYFFHRQEHRYHPEADDIASQDRLFDLCQEITGVSFKD